MTATRRMHPNSYQWWQRGIVYQVYPRSFMDSNGDGTGDLPGILNRLDYLDWLGVDAIWISPIFPSPMADCGYDVADHTDVHPLFGTRDDRDRLVEAAHARNIRVLLDYVPNHTSDQHPWFVESRRSRQSPKRDWYLKEQPDLNWRTHAVRTAMLDVLRFWFERGIDGFRIDALRQVFKDQQLRDNPPNPSWTPALPPYESLLPV